MGKNQIRDVFSEIRGFISNLTRHHIDQRRFSAEVEVDESLFLHGILYWQERNMDGHIWDHRKDNKGGKDFYNGSKGPVSIENLLIRHLERGTIIHHDGWRGYIRRNLIDMGFVPRRHVHRQHSIIMNRRGTNQIESLWSQLKYQIKKIYFTFHPNNTEDFLMEAMWRRNYSLQNLNEFEYLINALKENMNL